jgi:23S rRNA (cytidine1920-2'-O)/16S rRNA (cytidine1409-2'-O)-methyltransferase
LIEPKWPAHSSTDDRTLDLIGSDFPNFTPMPNEHPTPIPAPTPVNPFVSRGGLKLHHALATFKLNVTGARCADFGANVGGFTDTLLQAGAAHVTAVDTGYGTLAWKLRQDPRVRVLERTNALHAAAPADAEKFDVVVIDMGWTPQRLCIPAALRWLKVSGRIVTLIKPHYEVDREEKRLLQNGVLPTLEADRIAVRVMESMSTIGGSILASCQSPIVGGKTKGNAEGNREWLALIAPSGCAERGGS